jgi:thiol:disulfide interchange protein
MNKLRRLACTLLLALPALSLAAAEPAPRFDPQRDAAADVALAVAQARAQGKRVIVDVGGEWCPWCHILDRFLAANDDVRKLRDAHYVWVKVNFSPENRNRELLSKWPRVKGYPHLFVLDARGDVLHSQDTGLLEAGKDYDRDKMLAFFKEHRLAR